MSRALKRAATIAGGLVCIAAAVLLVARGFALRDALGERIGELSWTRFLVALGLYLSGSVLLGFAWIVLVRRVAAAKPRGWPLLRGHLRAQVAKYLPGNVFHFAYRHAAARSQGVAHAPLAAALALEAALLLVAAGLVAFGVAADPRLVTIAPWAREIVWATPLLAALACWALGAVAPRFGVPRRRFADTAPRIALVLLIDLSFFALAAAALRSLCLQPDALPFTAWCGWLAIAWLLGYVTPGAPAGLGLREAVLALGLAPAFGESEALALALFYRLVTVATDGLLAVVGFLARGPAAEPRTD